MPDDAEIIRRLADGEDPWVIDPDNGCANPLTGYFPFAEVQAEKKRREEAAKPKPPDCWLRKLQNDRLEICLKSDGVKVRASGTEEQMQDLVFWFEVATGRTVSAPTWKRPLRTGPRPIPGQVEIDDTGEPPLAMPELSSDATLPTP